MDIEITITIGNRLANEKGGHKWEKDVSQEIIMVTYFSKAIPDLIFKELIKQIKAKIKTMVNIGGKP